MSPAPSLAPDRLFAKDIAAHFRISERSARRWLRDTERTHGPSVVGRVGSGVRNAQRYTTRAALARVTPIAGQTLTEMHDRMAWIEDDLRRAHDLIADLMRRVGRMER